jgi:hypothetical protein
VAQIGRSALACLLVCAGCAIVAAAAHAAPARVYHHRDRGDTARVVWRHGRSTTLVDAERDTAFGVSLIYDRFTPSRDAHGRLTGGTDVSGVATGRRVSLRVDRQLGWAIVSARVRVVACHVRRNGEPGRCAVAGTVRVQLTFTGTGPTGRDRWDDRFHGDGMTIVEHLRGTHRTATVTGNAAGQSLRAADLEQAVIAHARGGGVTVCHAC